MINQARYIEELTKHINTFSKCYFDEAPNNASFPYSVLTPPITTNLSYGVLSLFDIEVYSNELSGAVELEELCDTIKNNLNDCILNLEDNFNSHIAFENYISIKDIEQDLMARRITFSARIIYK